MSVYKPFITSDVVVTPFKVNKSFSFKGASAITASNVGIDRFFGKNTPYISGSDLTGQIVSQSQALVYDSIKQLYYSNYIKGEDGSPVSLPQYNIDGTITGESGSNSYQPMYDNYLTNTLEANRFFPTGSDDIIGVMSIPSKMFGEYLKPGSFRWKASGLDITDDGEGGLFYSGTQVGNIIYEHGMAVLSNWEESRITNMVTGSNITCSFESTMTIYESQYKCTFNPSEYNYTQNPSAISGSSNSGIVVDFLTGSYFEPYITTVGLYNNDNELVAIGKLSQPLQSSNVSDTTILVNLDL